MAFLEILSACTYYLITIFHKWVTFLPHDRWPFKANTTVTKQEKAQLKLSTVYKHSSQWSSYRSVDLFWHLLLDQEQCFRTTRASSQYLLYICMNETISSPCTLDSPSLSLCCVAEQSGCRMHFGWGYSQIHPGHSSTVSLALWKRWICYCKSTNSIQGERESLLKPSKRPPPSVRRASHPELTMVL